MVVSSSTTLSDKLPGSERTKKKTLRIFAQSKEIYMCVIEHFNGMFIKESAWGSAMIGSYSRERKYSQDGNAMEAHTAVDEARKVLLYIICCLISRLTSRLINEVSRFVLYQL